MVSNKNAGVSVDVPYGRGGSLVKNASLERRLSNGHFMPMRHFSRGSIFYTGIKRILECQEYHFREYLLAILPQQVSSALLPNNFKIRSPNLMVSIVMKKYVIRPRHRAQGRNLGKNWVGDEPVAKPQKIIDGPDPIMTCESLSILTQVIPTTCDAQTEQTQDNSIFECIVALKSLYGQDTTAMPGFLNQR